jgi:hypothetical protein
MRSSHGEAPKTHSLALRIDGHQAAPELSGPVAEGTPGSVVGRKRSYKRVNPAHSLA